MGKLSFALNPASNLKTFQAAVRVELAFNALRCVSGSGNRADKCRHILSSIGDGIFHKAILHIGEKEQWCAEWHSVMKMHKKDKDNNPKRFETKQWLIKKILSTFSESILITRICVYQCYKIFSCGGGPRCKATWPFTRVYLQMSLRHSGESIRRAVIQSRMESSPLAQQWVLSRM